MDFLEKLNHLMEERKINKNVLSKESGIPYTTIDGFYKKGYQNAKLTTIKKLCDYFDVTLDYLMREDVNDINYGKPDNFEINKKEMHLLQKYRHLDERGQLTVDNTVDFEHQQTLVSQHFEAQQHKAELQALKEGCQNTVMNQSDNIIQFYDEKQNHEQQVALNYRTGGAGAGLGVDADNVDMIQVSYPADRVPAGANYVIPVSGDSMEPTFFDGDVLFFDLGNDCLQIGDIGIFVLNGETLVKELGENELISHNPKYKPIKIHEWDSVRIEGKVLGKM